MGDGGILQEELGACMPWRKHPPLPGGQARCEQSQDILITLGCAPMATEATTELGSLLGA